MFKVPSVSLWMHTRLGSSQIKKLKENKEMHVWSLQLMNKLLKHAERRTHEVNLNKYEQNRRHYGASSSEYGYFQRGEGSLYIDHVHYK